MGDGEPKNGGRLGAVRITFDIADAISGWGNLVHIPRWISAGWRWWRASHQLPQHLRAVRALDLPPDARVGELCFGAGAALADLIAAVPEGQVWAIDPSADMVRMADHTFRPWVRSGQLCLVCGWPWSVPLPDGSLDAVLINDGMRMWPDLATGFAEVSRLLGRTGRMVVCLDHLASPERAIEIVGELGFAVAIEEVNGGCLLTASRL